MPRSRYAAVALTLAAAATITGSGVAAPVAKKAARLVTGKQIKDGAVTGAKVRNGSLTAKDLRKGLVKRGAPGAPGAAGAQGPTGAGGGVGPAGQPGTTGGSTQFLDGPGGGP